MSNKPRRKKPPRPAGTGTRGAPRAGASGGVDINSMMAQVQEMQAQMAAAKESLAEKTVTATAGGGMVEVELSGGREVRSISLAPEVVDPDDIEMLQDLIVAALNEALRQIEEMAGQAMGGPMAGLELGGIDLASLGLGDVGGLLEEET